MQDSLKEKIEYYYTQLIQNLGNNIRKLENNQTFKKVKHNLYPYFIKIFIFISFINLLLCLVQLQTLISILIFFYSLYLFINHKYIQFRDNGLIYYLPVKWQNTLLRRSIFDFLCDLWYFSKIKLYFQAILVPLFLKPNPEKVNKYLHILPKTERKYFFIKGIVYTLPKNLQKLMFPKKSTIYTRIPKILNEGMEDDDITNKSEEDIKFEELENESIIEKNSDTKSENLDNNSDQHFKRKNSKILLSSKMMKELKFLPAKFSPEWDNLLEYKKIEKKKNQKKQMLLASEFDHSSGKKNISYLSFVMQFIQLQKRSILDHLSYKVLILSLSISSSVLITKIVLSPKIRRMLKSFLLKLGFSLSLVFVTGSTVAILLKKNQKNLPPRQNSFMSTSKMGN